MNPRWWRIFAKVEFVRVGVEYYCTSYVTVGLGFGLCVDRIGVVSK